MPNEKTLIQRQSESRIVSTLKPFFGFKEYLLAFFLLAGNFKPNPAVNTSGYDLTLLAAIATALCVASRLLRGKSIPLKLSVLVLLFFALFLPGLLWTDWTGYAVLKASKFFSLTLLSTLAPIYLIRSRAELRRFLSGFVILCGLIALAAPVLIFQQGSDLDRLMVFSATTIATGRAIGVVILLGALLWFETSTHRTVLAVSLSVMATSLIATGSRGPLLATPLALLFTLYLFRKRVRVGFAHLAFVALIGFIVFRASVPIIPWESLFRVGTFASGEFNNSEIEREDLFIQSWDGIVRYPLGLGLGGFASKYGFERDTDAREFPHNILLEVFLEGGWVAGLYFLYLLWYASRSVYVAALTSNLSLEFQLALCILLFLLCNDLVSGELNDSKALLSFMGLCIGMGSGFHQNA